MQLHRSTAGVWKVYSNTAGENRIFRCLQITSFHIFNCGDSLNLPPENTQTFRSRSTAEIYVDTRAMVLYPRTQTEIRAYKFPLLPKRCSIFPRGKTESIFVLWHSIIQRRAAHYANVSLILAVSIIAETPKRYFCRENMRIFERVPTIRISYLFRIIIEQIKANQGPCTTRPTMFKCRFYFGKLGAKMEF